MAHRPPAQGELTPQMIAQGFDPNRNRGRQNNQSNPYNPQLQYNSGNGYGTPYLTYGSNDQSQYPQTSYSYPNTNPQASNDIVARFERMEQALLGRAQQLSYPGMAQQHPATIPAQYQIPHVIQPQVIQQQTAQPQASALPPQNVQPSPSVTYSTVPGSSYTTKNV